MFEALLAIALLGGASQYVAAPAGAHDCEVIEIRLSPSEHIESASHRAIDAYAQKTGALSGWRWPVGAYENAAGERVQRFNVCSFDNKSEGVAK